MAFRKEHICPYVKKFNDAASGCKTCGVVCYEDEFTQKGCNGCGFYPQEQQRRAVQGKVVEMNDPRYPDSIRKTLFFRKIRP